MNNRKYVILAAVLVCSLAQIYPSVPTLTQFGNLRLFGAGSQTCCSAQTVTVYGAATIQAVPDTASLSAQLSVNGNTVAQAVAQLSTQVSCVINILTSNGLNSSNYQTSSLSVYPNTSYSNGVSTVIGQIATQSFTITLPTISPNGSNIGKLIDGLASVNGIFLNGLTFDIANKTSVFATARASAYTDAQNKALDYTTSLQLCLGQLVTVIDSYSSAPVTTEVPQQQKMMLASSNAVSTPTTVNVGTIPISYNLEAIFSYS